MASEPAPFVEPYPGFSEENKGPLILTVTSVLTSVAFVFVTGRIYSRIISVGKLAADDYIVILCILLCICYVALAAVAISYGGGRHVATLEPYQVMNAVYYTVVSFVPGVTSFIIPKFAGVILLARLLNPRRVHVYIMWAISIVYLLLGAGMLAINFGQCTPAAAQWGAVEGTCWDRQITVDYALALGVYSVLFDLYLAIYPTIVLWQLQMNWKKKLALSSSLGFGYCAGAVTIYKCTTLPGLLHLQDFTYAVDDVVLWTNIEANCVLIGTCIPTLFPLVKKLFGSTALGGSTPGYSSSRKKTGGQDGPVVTIGSYPTNGNKKRRGKSRSLSQFDTVVGEGDDGKYIILEERSFHASTAELRPEDASEMERVKATKQSGW
ncbi:hypothetical protein QBC47DRAFT_319740 [Echria macrotheca]|uniref:Rhodopsin domain-containing protein n=1 Tax=Echria macrotheca TaxID=438768 RepID=A0AAJ0BH05_9PEZI|nr:hypothetical protein QBC47DRAFT_319740 [Echria macrotheca]